MKQSWRAVFEAFVCKSKTTLKNSTNLAGNKMLHPASSSTWYPPHFLQQFSHGVLNKVTSLSIKNTASRTFLEIKPWVPRIGKLTMCHRTAMKAERLSPLTTVWRYLWSFMHVIATHTNVFNQNIYSIHSQYTVLLIYIHLRHGAGSRPYPLLREGSIPCQFLQQSLPSTLENAFYWLCMHPFVASS